MDITNDIIRRTGATQDDAEFYAEKARKLIDRRIPGISWTDDVWDAAADIAVYMWQRDKASINLAESLGTTAETITEGRVSVKQEASAGYVVNAQYNAAIEDILATLKAGTAVSGVVRFL